VRVDGGDREADAIPGHPEDRFSNPQWRYGLLSPSTFFDLSSFDGAELFEGVEYVWDALKRLQDYLARHARRDLRGSVASTAAVEGDVMLAQGAAIEPSAMVLGPAIIGPGCRVGHGALLRGGVVMGAGSAVGHAVEVKASILLPDAHAPHFNYVGDSILGGGCNLGAGAICSNFKLTKTPVTVTVAGTDYDTGLLKLGAIVGDGSQVGCNTVLNPGTLLGRNVLTYAGVSLRGYVPADSIVKLSQDITVVERR
jgi:NDP-sugar pyrophosphorylase family protein